MFSQRGNAGVLKSASRVVAQFGTWQLIRPDEVLGAQESIITVNDFVIVDTFCYRHQILDIWLDCGSAWWTWRCVGTRDGSAMTVTGRPEIRVK